MKTRNLLLLIFGVFANFLIETVLQSRIHFFDLWPDTIILMTVVIGSSLGSSVGALYGMGAGLLIDVLYAPYVGFYSLGYMLCGYISGLFNTQYFSRLLFVPPLFAFAFSLAKEGLLYLQLSLLGYEYELGVAIMRYFVPSAALTALLTVPIFAITRETWRTEWRRARWESLREG